AACSAGLVAAAADGPARERAVGGTEVPRVGGARGAPETSIVARWRREAGGNKHRVEARVCIGRGQIAGVDRRAGGVEVDLAADRHRRGEVRGSESQEEAAEGEKFLHGIGWFLFCVMRGTPTLMQSSCQEFKAPMRPI